MRPLSPDTARYTSELSEDHAVGIGPVRPGLADALSAVNAAMADQAAGRPPLKPLAETLRLRIAVRAVVAGVREPERELMLTSSTCRASSAE